ncbi:hypothetical protein [Mycobacterium gastri]|uniref:Uncharacterized protein n=1 Tax=Mycobacterium gastri TaxID=1777 RepID=A0A1X1VAB2_MYCGS|nr:hypothetical protein [Mycobacterium gastri]ETW24724.1 hypothetical protein MGAST_06880 [Mycobacterium gastri 'Wayne']ORV65997.1 hypothetical protein AWC07_11430 [Mycobacterium gastri]
MVWRLPHCPIDGVPQAPTWRLPLLAIWPLLAVSRDMVTARGRRAAREYKLPGPWRILVAVPIRNMRPNHHPSTEASMQMAMDYR